MRNKRIIIVLMFGMMSALTLIGCGASSAKTITSISISSADTKPVAIDFEAGDVSGGIPKIVKPEKSELDDLHSYINKNWSHIKDGDYMSKASKTEDTALLWKIEVRYSSGKTEKAYGDETFPEEWKELISMANKLIGMDYFNEDIE
jgi:hypothetical protein